MSPEERRERRRQQGRESQARYKARHPDRVKNSTKAFRVRHREACEATVKKWKSANPLRVLQHRRKNLAKKYDRDKAIKSILAQLPDSWDSARKFDVATDLLLMVLDGEIAIREAAGRASEVDRRLRRAPREVSLDAYPGWIDSFSNEEVDSGSP